MNQPVQKIRDFEGADPNIGTSGAEFPASAWQERYWNDANLARGGVALNVAMRWEIHGTISDKAVEQALQALSDRHEILRTCFAEREGKLLQLVKEHARPSIAFIDLQRLAQELREPEAERLGKEEAHKPFDLGSAPLFRAMLIRLSSHRAVFHLTLHHLIMDGWSIGIVIREFGQFAAAIDEGRILTLPEVDLHYADYVLWQGEALKQGAWDQEREYWLAKLNGLPRFEVEPDHPRSPQGSNAGDILSILLPRSLTDAVEAIARSRGQTLNSIATATLAAMLHCLTGDREIILGTQVAGRDAIEAENIVGPLINTLVLRLDTAETTDFASFAEYTQGAIQNAMAHQRLPFNVLTRYLGGEPDPARPPVYAVNFVLQKAYIDTAKTTDTNYGSFKLVSRPSHSAGALWDMFFFMVERDTGWRMSCEYNRDLYHSSTVENMLRLWQQTFEAITNNGKRPISRLLQIDAANLRRPKTPRLPRIKVTSLTPGKYNPRIAALQERVLCIQPKGHKTPVIAINNTAVLYPLASYIGEDRPFFDIHFCPASQPQDLPKRHFSDIARDAAEMIRLARPHGPYILLGLCMFGTVTLEAAQLLKAEGEEVELVVLNDSWAPGYREMMPWHDRQIRAWQIRFSNIRNDWTRYRNGEMTFTRFLSGYRIARKTGVLDWAISLNLLKKAPDANVLIDENRWFTDYLLECSKNYRPAQYDGHVLLFRSEEAKVGRLFDHGMGWRPIVSGQLDVFPCPGQHHEMFRDAGSRVIAREIRAALHKTEAF
jgi:thioesterase domain-containing protein